MGFGGDGVAVRGRIGMNTYVPAGASCSSPSIVNVARPIGDEVQLLVAAGGISVSSVWGSTTSWPASLAAVYGVAAERPDPERGPDRATT